MITSTNSGIDGRPALAIKKKKK